MMPIRRNNSQNWLPSVFNDFFDNDWMFRTNMTAPAVNVMEHDGSYDVEVAAPGMTKEDFNVRLANDNQLVISMEKKNHSEEKSEEKGRYLRREFTYSKFQQALVLPDDVNRELINAAVKDGVLHINLPKMTPQQKEEECRMIEIQ